MNPYEWNPNESKQDQATHVVNILVENLSEQQRSDVFHLQVHECFGDVPGQEIEEDFFTEPVSRVLCYIHGQLAGCAGTRVRPVQYAGQTILLGGISGVCTHRDHRGKSVATRVCRCAMQFLAEAKCDVVFLSTSEMARKLYENLGFRPLWAGFSWENIHGQVKTGDNGMLAPVCSLAVAEAIWQGREILHVGRGYW
jgi:ribosomal protein S18 acetylase RimI-like enzyme